MIALFFMKASSQFTLYFTYFTQLNIFNYFISKQGQKAYIKTHDMTNIPMESISMYGPTQGRQKQYIKYDEGTHTYKNKSQMRYL